MSKLPSIKRIRAFLRPLASWGLLILAMISIINYAKITKNDWNAYMTVLDGVDDATRWENRFADLKSSIPADASVVGYVSADPQNVEFILTQYAIIPFILQHGTAPEWIIFNYQGKSIRLALEKLGLKDYSTESYGYGIYLVHKK